MIKKIIFKTNVENCFVTVATNHDKLDIFLKNGS